MEISSSLNGLRSLLGVGSAAQGATQANNAAATTGSGLDSDRATLSGAGGEVAQTASGDDVRTDKVAAIQSALSAGTYNVAASAVASKLVDSMLGGGQ
jgi:negative regulator of flagellin synthesis FlgM